MHYPIRTLIALLFLISASQSSIAQPVSYIMVERVGTGAAALTSAATDVFLDQYLPNTPGQAAPQATVTFPTTVSGSQRRLTDSGTGTSSGYFTRFVNGLGYAVPGYDAPLGTATVTSTAPATVNRIVGTVSPTLTVDTQTGFSNGGTFNFRSVATVDGSSFWGTTSNAADGVIYLPASGTVGSFTQIVGASSRNIRIFNNSLFYSTMSATSALNGIFLAGTPGTLPTSSTTGTQLPGVATSGIGTSSAYGFFLLDNPLNANNWNSTGLDTLYVADDRTTSNGGGIQRWIYNGTNWILSDTFASPARGITATIDVSGLVNIWYTTTQASNNNLNFTQDILTANGGNFTSATILASAGTNRVFRGVDLDLIVAVPEPGTYALLAVAGFFGLQWYLRRKPGQKAEVATT